jgi:hypothetical protein
MPFKILNWKNNIIHLNTLIYNITTKIVKNLIIIVKKQKKSPQDGCQMVEMKFNSYKIIPHYYNNIFALHMHTSTIFALIFNTLNIAIH